jgi:hypothetical protein
MVDFSALQISYKETLPDFAENTIRRVDFVSATLYFVGVNLKSMNTNIGTA